MNWRLGIVIMIECCLLGSSWVSAAEIRVLPGSGTLQAAINSAGSGDTLLLEGGTFLGGISTYKSVVIRPVNRSTVAYIPGEVYIPGGDIQVTMQGLKFESNMYLASNSTPASVRILENEWFAGSIYGSNNGAPKEVVIVGNHLHAGSITNVYTDGAYIAGNTLDIGDITLQGSGWVVGNFVNGQIVSHGYNANILANRVNYVGKCTFGTPCAGIYAYQSSYIAGNIIQAEIGDTSPASAFQIGIYAAGGYPTVINNIIDGSNVASGKSRSGYGIRLASQNALATGNIVYNFIIDNTTTAISTTNYATITNNLCYNATGGCPSGEGNLNADPKFIDLLDYNLQTGSPAIDAGPPDYGMSDLNRTRNDIGAHGGPWSIGQYDQQRDPNNYTPYVFPLYRLSSNLSGGLLEVKALGVARLR